MDDDSTSHPPAHASKKVSAESMFWALLSGWKPEDPDKRPSFIKGFGNFLYTLCIGWLERYPSLLPTPTGERRRTVDRTRHLAQQAILLAAEMNDSRTAQTDEALLAQPPQGAQSWTEAIERRDKPRSARSM